MLSDHVSNEMIAFACRDLDNRRNLEGAGCQYVGRGWASDGGRFRREEELPEGVGAAVVGEAELSVGEAELSVGEAELSVGEAVSAAPGETVACAKASTTCGVVGRAVGDSLLRGVICSLATKSLSRSGALTSPDVNVALSWRSGPGSRERIAVTAPARAPAVRTTAITRRHQLDSGFFAVWRCLADFAIAGHRPGLTGSGMAAEVEPGPIKSAPAWSCAAGPRLQDAESRSDGAGP